MHDVVSWSVVFPDLETGFRFQRLQNTQRPCGAFLSLLPLVKMDLIEDVVESKSFIPEEEEDGYNEEEVEEEVDEDEQIRAFLELSLASNEQDSDGVLVDPIPQTLLEAVDAHEQGDLLASMRVVSSKLTVVDCWSE